MNTKNTFHVSLERKILKALAPRWVFDMVVLKRICM